MSIDTVFQPRLSTVLVTNTAVQLVAPGTASGMMTFRVVNLSASAQRFGWAATSAGASASAPGGTSYTNGVTSVNMLGNSVETFELPYDVFVIAGTSTGFEFTPGQGS